MDSMDLSAKLEQFLNTPGSMEKVSAALESLGGASQSGILASLASGVGGIPGPGGIPNPDGETPDAGGFDLGVLAKLAPLVAGGGKDDRDTRLLKALRPYFHGEREKRLGDAIQIIRLLNLLPALQGES